MDSKSTAPLLTDPPMSESDLRSALETQLRASGVADDLKAQLRAKIIHHLNGPSGGLSAAARATHRPCPSSRTVDINLLPNAAMDLSTSTLVHTVANTLVADYLASHDLNYSLSVYLPETSQIQPPTMDISEIEELLRLNSKTTGPINYLLIELQKSASQSSSILEGLIRGVRRLESSSLHQQTQTDEVIADQTVRDHKLLVEKIREESRRELLEQARKHDVMFEERLSRELGRQMDVFRSTEIKRLEVEARESVLSKLEQASVNAERSWAETVGKLKKEIEDSRARSISRELELETIITSLRSKLSEQVQATMSAEESARRQIESQVKAKEIDISTLQRQVSDLQLRVNQLTSERDDARNRIESTAQSVRLDASRQQADFVNKLKLQEAKLEADQQLLDERRRHMDRYLSEEEELRRELASTRKLLEQAQSQIFKLQQDLQVARVGVPPNQSGMTEPGLTKELHEMRAKLEDAMSRFYSTSNSEQIQSLKQSEQKWQTECQGLITRLEREYRRNDDLERQLGRAKNAENELKMEVMHLRVLLHQLSVNRTSRTGSSSTLDPDSLVRFNPDPLLPLSTSSTSPTRSIPPRRSKQSSSRDYLNSGRTSGSCSEEDVPSAAEISPTSRESLISDMSSAELRILRTKTNELNSIPPLSRGSRELLSFTASPCPNDDDNVWSHENGHHSHENGRHSHMSQRFSSPSHRFSISREREVMIAASPIPNNENNSAYIRPVTPDRLSDSVPSDLSASERKILSRRASRDRLSSPTTDNSPVNILGSTVVGLGLAGFTATTTSALVHPSVGVLAPPSPVSPNSFTNGETGTSMPHDFSGQEIKILQRRTSRELGPDAEKVLNENESPPHHTSGTHLVRTRSNESNLSDLSTAELRLLTDSMGHDGHTKSLAEVDAAPRKVHMASKENLVSDLSGIEKKLLVKSSSPSTRSSMDDLSASANRQIQHDAMMSGSTHTAHGHTVSPHERKVVILSRDEEVEVGPALGASRDSVSSSGTRHVAFTTTDEEHEVDTEGGIRRVAFGASKEHIVESRIVEDESESIDRPRLVSFEGSEANVLPSGEVKNTTTSTLYTNKLTDSMAAATNLPTATQTIQDDKLIKLESTVQNMDKRSQSNSIESKVHELTKVNPSLLQYMNRIAAQGISLPIKKSAPDEIEELSDIGTGDTISAASGTTTTTSSSK